MADQVAPVAPKDTTVLLRWKSLSRPFRRRSKEFYKTAFLVVVLVILLLFLAREFVAGITTLIVFALYYVLFSVPPEEITHTMTQLGIETANYFHRYEEMKEFWFDERSGEKMLMIRMYVGFPSHLQLLLGGAPEEKIKEILSSKIPFREVPERTFLDRASMWLSHRFPLERTS
ncbi:hypothetical protein HY408_00845 [Candidatus Gottesmanbacteria bacterium]|nr:hypothetical protein [Candidatus Gottesmanbacteria bacterium]